MFFIPIRIAHAVLLLSITLPVESVSGKGIDIDLNELLSLEDGSTIQKYGTGVSSSTTHRTKVQKYLRLSQISSDTDRDKPKPRKRYENLDKKRIRDGRYRAKIKNNPEVYQATLQARRQRYHQEKSKGSQYYLEKLENDRKSWKKRYSDPIWRAKDLARRKENYDRKKLAVKEATST